MLLLLRRPQQVLLKRTEQELQKQTRRGCWDDLARSAKRTSIPQVPSNAQQRHPYVKSISGRCKHFADHSVAAVAVFAAGHPERRGDGAEDVQDLAAGVERGAARAVARLAEPHWHEGRLLPIGADGLPVPCGS